MGLVIGIVVLVALCVLAVAVWRIFRKPLTLAPRPECRGPLGVADWPFLVVTPDGLRWSKSSGDTQYETGEPDG